MIAGWIAVLVALLSLVPGFVPGAASVIGFLISLAAVPLSLLSVRSQGNRFFLSVVGIVVIGALLVNGGLRIWLPTRMPVGFHVALLVLGAAVIGVCAAVAHRMARRNA
ncbi:MAG TPA: hypothetical protein VGE12_09380 [Noviherbaspirillum sp.]